MTFQRQVTVRINDVYNLVTNNSYLFNEFMCNFGFFWNEWTSLKLE
jgi:hypothetical protein